MAMKCIYPLLLLMLACSPVGLYAENETGYLSSIDIRQGNVLKQNRTVALKMSVDLSKTRIRTQHTVALTPVLVSADGTREVAFPPIVIDGKTRHKVYLRAQRLESVDLPPFHNDEAQVIIRQSRKNQQYDYEANVPYERWMLNGRIEMREEVHGCTNCGKGQSEKDLLTDVLPAYTPNYRLGTIAPEPEPVKVRAETRSARLQFRVDSYNIRTDFRNNRTELDSVMSSINLVVSNPDIKITDIYITGYASPEASIPYNYTLSKNRAQALAQYITHHDAISAEMLHVDSKGEDWDGFVQALADFPKLKGRDKIYEIIERYPDDHDLCEQQIKKQVGADTYTRLLNEVYPRLRRTDYRIEYNVRNFNLEEARRMVNERPDLLSLSEMYKVAGSYEKGSADYNKVMATAIRYFPNSPAALNDNALNAMEQKDYATAVRLLEKSSVTNQNAELLSTLGVAYTGVGEYEKAEAAFRRASDMGSTNAKHNLEEVTKVIDQL